MVSVSRGKGNEGINALNSHLCGNTVIPGNVASATNINLSEKRR